MLGRSSGLAQRGGQQTAGIHNEVAPYAWLRRRKRWAPRPPSVLHRGLPLPCAPSPTTVSTSAATVSSPWLTTVPEIGCTLHHQRVNGDAPMVVPEGCCFGTMHGIKEQHRQVLDLCTMHGWSL